MALYYSYTGSGLDICYKLVWDLYWWVGDKMIGNFKSKHYFMLFKSVSVWLLSIFCLVSAITTSFEHGWLIDDFDSFLSNDFFHSYLLLLILVKVEDFISKAWLMIFYMCFVWLSLLIMLMNLKLHNNEHTRKT